MKNQENQKKIINFDELRTDYVVNYLAPYLNPKYLSNLIKTTKKYYESESKESIIKIIKLAKESVLDDEIKQSLSEMFKLDNQDEGFFAKLNGLTELEREFSFISSKSVLESLGNIILKEIPQNNKEKYIDDLSEFLFILNTNIMIGLDNL